MGPRPAQHKTPPSELGIYVNTRNLREEADENNTWINLIADVGRQPCRRSVFG